MIIIQIATIHNLELFLIVKGWRSWGRGEGEEGYECKINSASSILDISFVQAFDRTKCFILFSGMDGRELWSSVVSEALAIYIKRIVTFCKQIPGM